jgi:hypothetical protein
MEPLLILKGVREVASLAKPTEPRRVSQRAFDAASEAAPSGSGRSPGLADLPRARQITEQLGLPWRDVLSVAHEPEARQNQLLPLKARGSRADWVTPEHVVAVLQLVAHRLCADSLTTAEYRAERARLLATERYRPRSDRWLLLPDDEQVIACAGSWDAALVLAGLAATRDRASRGQPGAPTLVDLLERFHDEHGFQPSARDLRGFARGNRVPYPSERAQRFGAGVAEWVASRSARGLPGPRVVRRAGGRGKRAPDYSGNVGAARPGERRREKWTRASCAAAVARYLAQLGRGERSTQRGYADWAAAQPRGAAPAVATIQALGGWEAVRRKAQVLGVNGGTVLGATS